MGCPMLSLIYLGLSQIILYGVNVLGTSNIIDWLLIAHWEEFTYHQNDKIRISVNGNAEYNESISPSRR